MNELAILKRVKRLIDEALPKFNWGASALDGNAIALLNEVPIEVNARLRQLETVRSPDTKLEFQSGCDKVTATIESYGLSLVARGPRGGYYTQTVPTEHIPALIALLRGEEPGPKRACPKCGDERHLYQAGADVRWRPEQRIWDHTGDYDLIECTDCDWTGTEEDTEVEDVEPADAPATP